MGMTPSILFGDVMHKRLFPKVNAFSYGLYYLVLPLSHLCNAPLPINRFGWLSFHHGDHGARQGDDLEGWARDILAQHHITRADGDITLITMPRVLGYVFNPVSFWLCHDRDGALRAVLCEVNNTFGETHTYLCAHPDQRPIQGDDVLTGDKVFHVSPFLPREGHYSFRFDVADEHCGLWINFHDAQGDIQLVTALNGQMRPMTAKALRKAMWRYPLITVKAIALIHWQALKLVAKGIQYIRKPQQKHETVSATHTITKL